MGIFGDYTTEPDIRRMANELVSTCITGPDTVKGGVASNIGRGQYPCSESVAYPGANHHPGRHGTLVMTLAHYNPENILCAGISKPVASDCTKAIEQMPVTEKYRKFGRLGLPKVDVDLPRVFNTGRK